MDRRSPPFMPKKHRDGAEVANGARDGPPSSTSFGNVCGGTQDPGKKSNLGTRHSENDGEQTQDPGTKPVPGAPGPRHFAGELVAILGYDCWCCESFAAQVERCEAMSVMQNLRTQWRA